MKRKKSLISLKVILAIVLIDFAGTAINISLEYLAMCVHSVDGTLEGYLLYALGFFGPIFVPFATVLCLILYFITLPIEKLTDKYLNHEQPDSKEIALAKKRIFLIPLVLIGFNVVGFMGGFFAYAIQRPFTEDTTYYFLFSIACALTVPFLQTSVFNQIVTKTREYLNIYYIQKDNIKSEMSLRYKIVLLFTSFVVYAMSLIVTHQLRITEKEKYNAMVLKALVKQEITLEDAKDIYNNPTKANSSALTVRNMYEENMSKNLLFISVTCGIMLLICFFVAFTFVTEILTQLKIQKNKLADILEGGKDLTKRINIIQNDEIGKLTDLINRFMDNMKTLFGKISHSSENIAKKSSILNEQVHSASASVEEISASISSVNKEIAEQMANVKYIKQELDEITNFIEGISSNVISQSNFVEETSAAMTEMVENIKSVNSITSKSAGLANNLVNVAKEGEAAVVNTIDAMKRIEETSRQVIEIIEVLNNLSGQTDLLAMNAAIEAAHAGAAGRGFAVIADEIRKLAEDSNRQANTINSQINEMMKSINEGVLLSENAGQAFGKILVDINHTTDLIQQVSHAMEEQSSGTNEILSSIESVINATNDIKGLASDLMARKVEINRQMEGFYNSSIHINKAIEEETVGSTEIVKLIETTRAMSSDNLEIVSELQEEVSSYKL